jgi:hypothetical protein
MDSDRDDVRREVLAELIELAREHAMQHRALKGDAERHGAEDTRLRAECEQAAWMEVVRVLRAERGDTTPL